MSVTMSWRIVLLVSLWLNAACSHQPDKIRRRSRISPRSLDLIDAHGIVMETRLGNAILPLHYHLKLEPYLEDGLFKGHLVMNLTFLRSTDNITVHSSEDLEILDYEVKVSPHNDPTQELEKYEISTYETDAKRSLISMILDKIIPESATALLTFVFKGVMETATTEAFFRTSYMTENEVEQIIAATALRPNNARRMFPCFDEPGYKATFQLSVVRPRNMVALSNVPVERTEDIEDEPDAVWDHFEQTPKMSTFAFGLIIADLKQMGNSSFYTDENGKQIELRVWGRQEYLEALKGVSEKLTRVFAEISKMWQVSLPLRRLDVVALPNYQGVKPADNWGLIVFRESDLSSRGYLQLAQELSYQWLGIYTTPAWWSAAHINKALVGYVAAEAAFKIDHGAEMEGKWPMTVLYSLYYEFSKRYPHSRITGMKQETACSKIELVFRMFNYTFGELTFKKGIKNFIESGKYRTFTEDSIWSAFSEAAIEHGKLPKDLLLKGITNSWIYNDRLPMVTVKRQYENNSALLTQKLYLRERPHDVPDAEKMIWIIPLVVITEECLDLNDTTPVAWMETKEYILQNTSDKNKFIILNPEEIAPYPVNYDTQNWMLLSNFLQSNNRTLLPELTRAKLLHDAWNLAYAGELSFATAFNMTLFLKGERTEIVWDPVFVMIDHIGKHICECVQAKFQSYVRTLLSPLYEELSKDKKDEDDGSRSNLRYHMKSVLCNSGYKPCIKEAQEQYSKWMQAKNPDDGNPVHNKYFCPVFTWGTRKEWEFGLQRVINFPPSRKPSERTYLLKTLAGCPRDESKIIRLLNVTILEGNGNFTETDMFLIFSMLNGNPVGYTTLFHFLEKNWDFLEKKYTGKTNLWDSLITSATSSFTTEDGLKLVTGLYVAHKREFGSAEHIIAKSVRNIREEAQWSAENLPVIEQWLDWYLATSSVKDDQFINN